MQDNKTSIEHLLKSTGRSGIDDLLCWMDNNGFYDAPCSSKYHLAKPGGLAEHSLNVYQTAIELAKTIYINHTKELTLEFIDSLVIVSILHDLGKAGQFGKENYKTTNELSMQIASAAPEYETNKELLYIPHEIRSIAIASRFIELTEEEQFAICYHNGLYGELQSVKNHETPLYMILHFADLWASRVLED